MRRRCGRNVSRDFQPSRVQEWQMLLPGEIEPRLCHLRMRRISAPVEALSVKTRQRRVHRSLHASAHLKGSKSHWARGSRTHWSAETSAFGA